VIELAVTFYALAFPFFDRIPFLDRMFSRGISFVDLTVLWVNFLAISIAAFYTRRAAVRADPRVRPLFGAITALAVFYAAAYLLLIMVPLDVAVWGSVLRGFSIIVWPLVWVGPAVCAVKTFESDHARLEDEVPST